MAVEGWKPFEIGEFIKAKIVRISVSDESIDVEVPLMGVFTLDTDSILPGMWNISNVGKEIILEVVSLRPLRFAQYGICKF